MKAFINLYLSLILPSMLLVSPLVIIYFMLEYTFSESIKISIIISFIFALILALMMAFAITIMPIYKKYIQADKNIEPIEPIKTTKKRKKEKISNSNIKIDTDYSFNTKIIVLMDKLLAFDVIVHAIIDKRLGKVGKRDKTNTSITILTNNHDINIKVQELTKHTSEIEIQSNSHSNNIENIINYIKNKEHSFLQY